MSEPWGVLPIAGKNRMIAGPQRNIKGRTWESRPERGH